MKCLKGNTEENKQDMHAIVHVVRVPLRKKHSVLIVKEDQM